MDPQWSEVLSAVKSAAANSLKGGWLYVTVGVSVVIDPTLNRKSLDQVAPENPVWVQCWSGHGLIVNTEALHRLGLSEEETDTDELHYERFPGTNRLSGRFTEYAQWVQLRRLASLATKDEKLKSLRAMSDAAIHFGVTSMQVMSTTSVDEFASLLNEAQLAVRIRAMDFTLPGTPSWTANSDQKRSDNISSMVRISGLKWILDGTPLERGAALRTAYADKPGWRGQLDLSSAKLDSVVKRAWRSNDQTLFHVAGDRASAELFSSMERAGPDEGWRSKRVRVEHGDGIMPDLVPLAVKLGIVVVQNPTHFSFPELMVARYGAGAKVSPFRSLALAGIPIALGSDGPMNPYLNIMFASIHPANPAEAFTRAQAIAAYTYGSAYAEFAETEKGTLTVGQLADVSVPSNDIITTAANALPAVHSVLTIVGGVVILDDGTLEHAGSKTLHKP
jgi:predicted amidohydrolase YtcJ